MESSGGVARGGVQQYSPGVLIGNWYEDLRVREDKLKLYKTQKMYATENEKAATLNPLALENLTARLEENVHLDGPTDGPVTFKRPLLIVNKKTNASLAVDMSPFSSPGPNKCAVSAAGTMKPLIRTSWTVQRCADTDNTTFQVLLQEHDMVHYGQRVRVANEDADTRGFRYLHSEIGSGLHSSNVQPVTASYSASADNVFIVHRAGAKRGDVFDGQPVMLGDPVVFIHSLTNTPLCCNGAQTRTAYGMELAVQCGYATEYHSRSLAAIVIREENIFYFSSGVDNDEFKLRSRATSGIHGMSIASGDGADEIIGRIRAGAIALGGRIGFRAISRSLCVACNEQRSQAFTRTQLATFISRLGVALLPLELDVLMKKFDRTGNNTVCAQELLTTLRGNMNPDRMKAVVRAHQQLVIEGEGSADFKDMFNIFRENANMHPDVADGLITREEAVFDFENCWPGRVGCKLGTVTLNEFIEYYNDISPAVDDDERFIRMVYGSWLIPATAEYRKGEPFRAVTVTHTNDTTETVKLPDSLVIDVTDSEAVKSLLIRHGIRDVASFQVSQRI